MFQMTNFESSGLLLPAPGVHNSIHGTMTCSRPSRGFNRISYIPPITWLPDGRVELMLVLKINGSREDISFDTLPQWWEGFSCLCSFGAKIAIPGMSLQAC